MNAEILAGYVSASELGAVFKLCLRAGAILILESFTDLQIRRVGSDEAEILTDPSQFEDGRMFDTEFELHWQRLRGYPWHILPFRVSVIVDDSSHLANIDSNQWQRSAGNLSTPMPLLDADSRSFYLWGEAVRGSDGNPTGQWYEKEVPRLFDYPCDHDSQTRRAKLVSKFYRLSLPSNETLLLNRFSSIVPAEE